MSSVEKSDFDDSTNSRLNKAYAMLVERESQRSVGSSSCSSVNGEGTDLAALMIRVSDNS